MAWVWRARGRSSPKGAAWRSARAAHDAAAAARERVRAVPTGRRSGRRLDRGRRRTRGRKTIETFGGIDILVNNVGRAGGGDLLDTTDAEWQAAFDETLFPRVRASRLAVPHMRQRGGGAILMIASIWGREAGGRMTYNAVKAAEISLAKALAQQLAPQNIRVNSVAPGSISFPGGSWHKRQQADPEGIAEFIARELPFGRFGRADERRRRRSPRSAPRGSAARARRRSAARQSPSTDHLTSHGR